MIRALFCTGMVLLTLAAPAHAADYDKYLLDDTSLLVVVNVRPALAAPLFAKHYQKQVDELLELDLVQQELKKVGVNPLMDIDHVVLAMGLSSHRDVVQAAGNAGFASSAAIPLVIVQGRFDPAKIHASLEKRAQDTRTIKVHEWNGAKYYQVIAQPGAMALLGGFVAVLDKDIVVASGNKDEIEEVLAKAAGKKKTQLKHKPMQALLEKRDPKLTVEVLACHEMVVDTSVRSVNMNGQNVTQVTRKTLEDYGIVSLRATLAAGDDIRAGALVVCKDSARAKDLSQTAEQGRKTAIDQVANLDALAPVLQFLKTVKTTITDRTIQMEGQGGGEILQALFLALLLPS